MKKLTTICLLLLFLNLSAGCAGEGASETGKPVKATAISITPTEAFLARQTTYLDLCASHDGLYSHVCRVAQGVQQFNIPEFDAALDKISAREDCADFRMNTLLRMLYLDETSQALPADLKQRLKDAVLGFKYWFTEPGEDAMIMWTENHQILFHTSELLAGQLYPDQIFTNSGMTGAEHVAHALPFVREWIAKRGRFGFSEWHSGTYYTEDLAPLVNLVDFAEDQQIATQAAALIDLIAFDFANNYFGGLFATTMGRVYDDSRRGTSAADPPQLDSTSRSAWLLLGLGDIEDFQNPSNMAAVALATSVKYIPPAILEEIAEATRDSHEHMERASIDANQGDQYGLSYAPNDLPDIMYWWGMSAPASSPVVDTSEELINTYGLDPELVFGDERFLGLLTMLANLDQRTLEEYCAMTDYVTRGVALETVNTYTYRTPHYQLSGAQDHQPGWNGIQELIWQASLDKQAYVYTNSPGGIATEEFVGGWKPRATLHKNVGIIQYDRDPGEPSLDGVLKTVVGVKEYMHAYFPQWAFDSIVQTGKWTFGIKDKGYLALYSDEPTSWESDYELRVHALKNFFIVELGSETESGSFESFQKSILDARIEASALDRGYDILYHSPSIGKTTVAWTGPMTVRGKAIDLGPYPRYSNAFSKQEFGELETVIETETSRLVLDFANGTRTLFSLER